MSDLHAVWIVRNTGRDHLAALKAMREARTLLGDLEGARLMACTFVLRQSQEGPVIVGQHPDLGVVQRAAGILDAVSSLTVAVDLDPSDAALIGPAGEPDDDDDTDYVGRTALTLLVMAQGNPSVAVMYATTLARNTGDEPLYEDVVAMFEDTFPPQLAQ